MSYDWQLAEYPLELDDSRRRLPFFALLLFIGLYFMRPWDQIPSLAAVHPLLLMTFLVVVLFLRTRPQIAFLTLSPSRLLLAMLFVMCVSVLFSYWPSQSLTAAIEYLKQIALFVLIVNLVTTIDRIKQFALVMTGCCAVHGVFAIYNYVYGTVDRLEGVADAIFADPNDLALSLVLVLPIAWWVTTVTLAKLPKLAVHGCIMLMIGGIVATQSRGGLIAMLTAVFVMVVTQGRERIGALILTLAAAVAFAVVVFPSDVFDRYSTITEYQEDESAMTRLAVWKAGIRMFGDHFLTGTGADTFELVYGEQYLDGQFGPAWRAAHNSYIQIAAELGICGILIWLAILASAFLSLLKSRSLLAMLDQDPSGESSLETKHLRDLSAALLASLTSFLVGAFFLSRGYDLLLMVLIALIAVLLRSVEAISAETRNS